MSIVNQDYDSSLYDDDDNDDDDDFVIDDFTETDDSDADLYVTSLLMNNKFQNQTNIEEYRNAEHTHTPQRGREENKNDLFDVEEDRDYDRDYGRSDHQHDRRNASPRQYPNRRNGSGGSGGSADKRNNNNNNNAGRGRRRSPPRDYVDNRDRNRGRNIPPPRKRSLKWKQNYVQPYEDDDHYNDHGYDHHEDGHQDRRQLVHYDDDQSDDEHDKRKISMYDVLTAISSKKGLSQKLSQKKRDKKHHQLDIDQILKSKKEQAVKTLEKSGLARLLHDDLDEIHFDDFDAGVNALALMCALVLSIPFEIIGGFEVDHLDWMKENINACNDDTWNFANVYTSIRTSFMVTVYFSISGMILATFYFLFKRNDDESYKSWRSKARYLVISLFVCTALAICGLIMLTNLYFIYFLLTSTANICDNGTTIYVCSGLGVSLFAFLLSFWFIY